MGISVNVSPIQFKDKDLTDTVLALLADHGLPADALTLELTETVELEDTAHLENFATLRSAGVHISIDDFGTGYANLGYLQKVHADELKIDHTFIKDIRQGSFHHTLISNIATFAKNNDIFICMEGVETPDELAVLELAEPDVLQGYLFDRPLVASEFEARYVTPENPVVWKFEEELQKQRERVRFAYFNTKDILANIKTGLWMLQLDEKSRTGMIYVDDVSRQIIGLDAPLDPRQVFDMVLIISNISYCKSIRNSYNNRGW
jgi:c-di-GMP-related signal transduction protein